MNAFARTASTVVTSAIVLLSGPVLLVASAEPLNLGVPRGSRPAPAISGPDRDTQVLPAPETRAFVPPLSRSTRTGRAGVAVWGAPGRATSPRGPGDPDSVGWAGAGVAIEWGAGPRGARSN